MVINPERDGAIKDLRLNSITEKSFICLSKEIDKELDENQKTTNNQEKNDIDLLKGMQNTAFLGILKNQTKAKNVSNEEEEKK